jgi:hypothetical protein
MRAGGHIIAAGALAVQTPVWLQIEMVPVPDPCPHVARSELLPRMRLRSADRSIPLTVDGFEISRFRRSSGSMRQCLVAVYILFGYVPAIDWRLRP